MEKKYEIVDGQLVLVETKTTTVDPMTLKIQIEKLEQRKMMLEAQIVQINEEIKTLVEFRDR